MNIQLIQSLRSHSLFNVKVLDTYMEGDCLQVLFSDKKSYNDWVLTNPIKPEEVSENKKVKRTRMMIRAYAL